MIQASDWFESTLNEEDRDPSLSSMLEDFLTPQIEAAPDPMQRDQLLGLYVSRLALDLPIEIQTLRDESDDLAFGTSPPSQWIETSVEPVLHRLRVTLVLDGEDAQDTGSAFESRPTGPLTRDNL